MRSTGVAIIVLTAFIAGAIAVQTLAQTHKSQAKNEVKVGVIARGAKIEISTTSGRLLRLSEFAQAIRQARTPSRCPPRRFPMAESRYGFHSTTITRSLRPHATKSKAYG